jgi:hypothetical protein
MNVPPENLSDHEDEWLIEGQIVQGNGSDQQSAQMSISSASNSIENGCKRVPVSNESNKEEIAALKDDNLHTTEYRRESSLHLGDESSSNSASSNDESSMKANWKNTSHLKVSEAEEDESIEGEDEDNIQIDNDHSSDLSFHESPAVSPGASSNFASSDGSSELGVSASDNDSLYEETQKMPKVRKVVGRKTSSRKLGIDFDEVDPTLYGLRRSGRERKPNSKYEEVNSYCILWCIKSVG